LRKRCRVAGRHRAPTQLAGCVRDIGRACRGGQPGLRPNGFPLVIVVLAVAVRRLFLAAVADRPDEEEHPPTGVDDAGTVERRSQLAPGRKRQRLPVQLWGQLLRPRRILGAATDSWSLQRRCSAAMTRCGRARLAAGATEIVSTPRSVGIRALRWCSQHRLGAASL
jgi:hypothetical protein